jgi:hypothetical protein
MGYMDTSYLKIDDVMTQKLAANFYTDMAHFSLSSQQEHLEKPS